MNWNLSNLGIMFYERTFIKILLVFGLYMISVSGKLIETEQMHILCLSLVLSLLENLDLNVSSDIFWDEGALFEQSTCCAKDFIWILLLMRSDTDKENFRSFKNNGKNGHFLGNEDVPLIERIRGRLDMSTFQQKVSLNWFY